MRYLGWVVGVEPTTSRATVWRSATELYPPSCAEVHFTRLSVHGAGAGTAWIAARAAWASSRTGLRRSISRHSEFGNLLLQALALALWTPRLLLSKHNGFKLVVAFLADVFKYRHMFKLRLKYLYPYYISHRFPSLCLNFHRIRRLTRLCLGGF